MRPLKIVVPSTSAELEWIVFVLFHEYLGIEYHIEVSGAERYAIIRERQCVELPDIFFASSKVGWLGLNTLPSMPLRTLAIEDADLDAHLVSKTIPVIYGDASKSIEAGEDRIYLPIDVLGSAFLMLSRYEELVIGERDSHGRFPASSSLAYRNGFLERPIIDEYVEILWACIKRLWPDMERKPRIYKTVVSCDVDHPYHASARSLSRLIKRTAGEIIRKRRYSDAVKPVMNYLASRAGDWRNDPYYYTIDWMMDVNERVGNKVAFYFIPEITNPAIDGDCSITDSAVRSMLRRIAARGHEIGIHPGYHTYQSAQGIAAGKRKLESVLHEEGVAHQVLGGRQHYLRWSTHTPPSWDAARLEYDSTLGYAECAGFRCGTCHEYSMYDLHERRRLRIKQRPLICMEVSVIDATGLEHADDPFGRMDKLKHAVRQVRGNFTLLWHNSSLESGREKDMYCNIIG